MKIAVFHELPPGGARIAVNEIAKRLKKKHAVDLYVVDEQKNPNEKNFYSTIHFYQFIPKVWEGNNWKIRIYKDTIELFRLFLLNKRIAEDSKKNQYDLLFVHASRFIESPFILRFPNVQKIFYLHDPHDRSVYEQDLITQTKSDIFRRLYAFFNRSIRKMLDKQNLDGADFFLANSRFTQKMFQKTYGKKSSVAYLGVDTDFFTPKRVEKIYDILYIGSRQPVDGYDLLTQSLGLMKRQPAVKTVFFEDEWLSRETMRDLYRRSKIVLALSHNEPFGLVPLEAMACGVPIIALNEGGYSESVLDKKTGYLISKNAKELAEKIYFLLTNKASREKMGVIAKIYVEKNWNFEKRVTELENLLQKII
ncbi:MAG TPA: glycosyltransferase family 4 protein [Patescibacteria group bacterium]|nr:glycosyltransferase family 4 protein [Patescibacteria group bacterium]